MSGGPQEAWAADRVCVCPPGPDAPGTTPCSRDAVSRADARPALAGVTPGPGAGAGVVSAPCPAALGKRTDGQAANPGLSRAQARWRPLPCVQASSAWSAR